MAKDNDEETSVAVGEEKQQTQAGAKRFNISDAELAGIIDGEADQIMSAFSKVMGGQHDVVTLTCLLGFLELASKETQKIPAYNVFHAIRLLNKVVDVFVEEHNATVARLGFGPYIDPVTFEITHLPRGANGN